VVGGVGFVGPRGLLLDMTICSGRIDRSRGRGCSGGGACVLCWRVSWHLIPSVRHVFALGGQWCFGLVGSESGGQRGGEAQPADGEAGCAVVAFGSGDTAVHDWLLYFQRCR